MPVPKFIQNAYRASLSGIGRNVTSTLFIYFYIIICKRAEFHPVKDGSIIANLKKDYFLLCKKENLAGTQSSKKTNRRATELETRSRTVSSINSPTSPCQWNVAISRLQHLDSVFDRDVKPVNDNTAGSADDDANEVSRPIVVLYRKNCIQCI